MTVSRCFWPVTLVLSVGAAACATSNASAQERVNSSQPIEVSARASSVADLEKAFWVCDHAATTNGVDGGTAIACGAITEELKMRKFSGDFDLMETWWRKNKPAEHQAVTAAGNAVSVR